MKILDFLNDKAVSANLTAGDKKGVIRELIELLMSGSGAKDRESMVKALLERESLGSTGIGQSIAIPHAKSDKVRKLIGAIGISKKGVDFDALDGEQVYIFFLLLAPMDSAGPHLKALARISRLLRNKYFRDSLKNAPDEESLLKIIKQEDEARD
ncbi:MAG: PTS sugar transporter subunit IIA [Candidatus Omnitrophica bacterium]|nr:PTS sugar transporter subunit IIA [Candidatus Omnitrophota bacterium]